MPWNIWQLGRRDAGGTALRRHVRATQSGNTKQTVVTARCRATSATTASRCRRQHDGVGVAFGAEYRQEGLQYETDYDSQTRRPRRPGRPALPIKGSYNVMDYFAEVRVPLVQDVAFAQDLTFNGSYRYSDYSTGVNTSTYGLGLDWAIIDDFKLRGSFQHAVRAPNIIELFPPAALGLFDLASDPCGSGADHRQQRGQCAADRAWHARRCTARTLDNPAGQYNAIFGGNTDLKPERPTPGRPASC